MTSHTRKEGSDHGKKIRTILQAAREHESISTAQFAFAYAANLCHYLAQRTLLIRIEKGGGRRPARYAHNPRSTVKIRRLLF